MRTILAVIVMIGLVDRSNGASANGDVDRSPAPSTAPTPQPPASEAKASSLAGPKQGSLLIVGGGPLTPAIVQRFVSLAGGPEAHVVVIPTAAEDVDLKDLDGEAKQFAEVFGFKHVSVLHTRNRDEANSDSFVTPLTKAKAVWFGGGRHWRLVDSYLGTKTHEAIRGVLDRGGVVGGSSAGATIMGSFLVRGAREGNRIMVAKDYQQGLGFFDGVAIDQHLLTRGRADDLVPVVADHPGLLGLGIDEATAIVAVEDEFEVLGRSVVGIYDGRDHDGKSYYFLAPGERFDLKTKRRSQRSDSSSGKASPLGAPAPTAP